MDAFALSLSYGITNLNKKSIILTTLMVGLFHFLMPLIGNVIGIYLFEYTIFNPKIVLFFVFLMLSIDMLISFFENESKMRNLNLIGTFLFSFSVSFDSLSVGLGIRYLYDNIIFVVSSFCFISALFTMLGFYLGKNLSRKIGKYSFLFGSIALFIYSLIILTN